MKSRLFILYFLFLGRVLAQTDPVDKGGRVILVRTKVVENASFYLYDPPFVAKAIYKDTIEAINRYPEQLMSSIISANSQEWVDYNTYGRALNSEKKDVKHFDFIKSMDRDKNYFELRSKLNFSINNSDYSIIKFFFYTTESVAPTSGAYLLQKVSNRWYSASNNSNTSNIALMMMRFREEKMKAILMSKKTGISIMDDLIQRITVDRVINLNLLYKEFSSWYVNNDKEKIEYFIDPKSW